MGRRRAARERPVQVCETRGVRGRCCLPPPPLPPFPRPSPPLPRPPPRSARPAPLRPRYRAACTRRALVPFHARSRGPSPCSGVQVGGWGAQPVWRQEEPARPPPVTNLQVAGRVGVERLPSGGLDQTRPRALVLWSAAPLAQARNREMGLTEHTPVPQPQLQGRAPPFAERRADWLSVFLPYPHLFEGGGRGWQKIRGQPSLGSCCLPTDGVGLRPRSPARNSSGAPEPRECEGRCWPLRARSRRHQADAAGGAPWPRSREQKALSALAYPRGLTPYFGVHPIQ